MKQMAATQKMATAALAVGAYEASRRLPIPGFSATTDQATKALLGVALLITAALIGAKGSEWPRSIMIGAGIGLVAGAGIPAARNLVG